MEVSNQVRVWYLLSLQAFYVVNSYLLSNILGLVLCHENPCLRSTTKTDVPIAWESTTSLPDETHSFEFGVSSLWGHDLLYIDDYSEEADGYYRSDVEI